MKKRILSCLAVCFMVCCFLLQSKTELQKASLIAVEFPTSATLKISSLTPTAHATARARDLVLASQELESTEYPIANGNCIKTYEPYKSFAEWSNQYKLQQMAETNEYGLRIIDGRYCVAVGSYFGMSIGQKFDIVLENGTVIPCVMGDLKADEHTDENNLFTVHSDCMAEFIVSTKDLPELARKMGNVSYAVKGWNNKIVSVTVYEENILADNMQ